LPYVQKHLDTPLFIIDPQAVAVGTTLSYEFDDKQMHIIYDGVRLDNVRGVWYRKPTNIEAGELRVDSHFADYSAQALRAHYVQLLSAFPNALWVSDYFALGRGGNKTLQLDVAKRIGFRVPATLITSDAQRAREFIESQDGGCIVKPYDSHSTYSKELPKSFLTTKVDRHTLPDLTNLSLAPAIFQQAIDAAYDVRVTVVGAKAFAAKIHTKGLRADSPVRDWRVGYFQGEVIVESYKDFPEDVARLCALHVKRLGLTFSAIDLVADRQGQLWFLENNPNGQWAFIEEESGLPIGKALADLLSGKEQPVR